MEQHGARRLQSPGKRVLDGEISTASPLATYRLQFNHLRTLFPLTPRATT
jgi:hypothetical protein